jgi:hypothetical protein
MPHPLFKEAAFLGSDGNVYNTGPFHNIDMVPEHIEIADEGFTDHQGRFFNRQQASELVNTKNVQSEQMFDQTKTQAQIDKIKQDAWDKRNAQ